MAGVSASQWYMPMKSFNRRVTLALYRSKNKNTSITGSVFVGAGRGSRIEELTYIPIDPDPSDSLG